MGLFTKDIKSLDDLFLQALGEILYIERRISKVLPGLIAKTSDPLLTRELDSVLSANATHIERVKEVFRLNGMPPKANECTAIDGIFTSAYELNEEIEQANVLDTSIAGAVQAVEAYSSVRYMTVIGWLQQLGKPECARLLRKNLIERQRASDALCQLAEMRLNARAFSGGVHHSIGLTG